MKRGKKSCDEDNQNFKCEEQVLIARRLNEKSVLRKAEVCISSQEATNFPLNGFMYLDSRFGHFRGISGLL